jgi:hypothetical protein
MRPHIGADILVFFGPTNYRKIRIGKQATGENERIRLFGILEGGPAAIEEALVTTNLELIKKQSPVASIDRALNSLTHQT